MKRIKSLITLLIIVGNLSSLNAQDALSPQKTPQAFLAARSHLQEALEYADKHELEHTADEQAATALLPPGITRDHLNTAGKKILDLFCTIDSACSAKTGAFYDTLHPDGAAYFKAYGKEELARCLATSTLDLDAKIPANADEPIVTLYGNHRNTPGIIKSALSRLSTVTPSWLTPSWLTPIGAYQEAHPNIRNKAQQADAYVSKAKKNQKADAFHLKKMFLALRNKAKESKRKRLAQEAARLQRRNKIAAAAVYGGGLAGIGGLTWLLTHLLNGKNAKLTKQFFRRLLSPRYRKRLKDNTRIDGKAITKAGLQTVIAAAVMTAGLAASVIGARTHQPETGA